MLSPYKLAKHDFKHRQPAVTYGPGGKPSKGRKGTICYRSGTVDWTVHRYAPAVYANAKPGSRRRKAVDHAIKSQTGQSVHSSHVAGHLAKSSPRWGEGVAPGRTGRTPVPMPHKKNVQVSKKTYAVAGAATAGAGYYYYRKRKNGKVEKVRNGRPKTHRAFHGSRKSLH